MVNGGLKIMPEKQTPPRNSHEGKPESKDDVEIETLKLNHQ